MVTWPNSIVVFCCPEVPESLGEKLKKRPFAACTGLDWFSEGFVPARLQSEELLYSAHGYSLLSIRRDDKVLPLGVIRGFLDAKIAEIEQGEMRKVGRKEKLAMKEKITDDLLPRAFTRSSQTSAWFGHGYAFVSCSSQSRAENVLSSIREASPPFPCPLIRTNTSPIALMTDWLSSGAANDDFALDSEVILKDSAEAGAVIRASRADLNTDEIRQHIATGKQVTALGLVWREKIRFVLTDSLQLKKLQFLNVLKEEVSQAGDDAESLFGATFLLCTSEITGLLNDLISAMGGIQSDAALPNSAE